MSHETPLWMDYPSKPSSFAYGPALAALAGRAARYAAERIGKAAVSRAVRYVRGGKSAGKKRARRSRVSKLVPGSSARPRMVRRVRARTRRPIRRTKVRRTRITTVKRAPQVTATWRDIVTSTYQVGAVAGYQGVGNQAYLTLSDFSAMWTKCTGAPSPSNINQRFYLGAMELETLFTNSTLGTIHVELYTIMSKRPTSNDPQTWTPGSSWATGIADETIADLSPGTFSDLGIKPSDATLFRNQWRVLKHQSFTMEQGATRRVHQMFPNRRVITGEYFLRNIASQPVGQTQVHNFTVHHMWVVRGQPTSNDTAVTLTECKIDVVNTKRLTYHQLPDYIEDLNYVDNLTSLANARIVNKGSGTIVTNDET